MRASSTHVEAVICKGVSRPDGEAKCDDDPGKANEKHHEEKQGPENPLKCATVKRQNANTQPEPFGAGPPGKARIQLHIIQRTASGVKGCQGQNSRNRPTVL